MHPDENPKYHPHTLEAVVMLSLSDIGRSLDDLVDGHPDDIINSFNTLFRTLEKLSPQHFAAIAATVKSGSSTQSVLNAFKGAIPEQWLQAGVANPVEMKAWIALDLSPNEAKVCIGAGLTPYDVYVWEGVSPTDVVRYTKMGYGPDDDVTLIAKEVGATAQEVEEILDMIPSGSPRGVNTQTLRFALSWAAVFDGDIVTEKYNDVVALASHMPPEEAERWGVAPHTVLQWVRLGHTRESFEAAVAKGKDPNTPTPYVATSKTSKREAGLSPHIVKKLAAKHGWVETVPNRTEPDMTHVRWSAYQKQGNRIQVRFVHNAALFVEWYEQERVVGFIAGHPDVDTQTENLFHFGGKDLTTTPLAAALLALQENGWDVQARHLGPLNKWDEIATPPYYGLAHTPVALFASRPKLQHEGIVDAEWVDVTATRKGEQISIAADTAGEILVVVTEGNEAGLTGPTKDDAIRKCCA